MNAVTIARLFKHVREAGPNTGQRVEAIQKWCGGKAGESWCCYFVTTVLDLLFQGKSPIPRHGSCQFVYDLAKEKSWLTDAPIEGDIFLYVDENDHAHHIGLVVIAESPEFHPVFIAGNTSEDGKSSNGNGVYERPNTVAAKRIKYIRYPR